MEFGPKNPPYNDIGGEEVVRRLVTAFYDSMDSDPEFAVIRALHPDDLTESREKLFEFLSGWLGGPELYVQRRGHRAQPGQVLHQALPVPQDCFL